jgi:hypothetical protein
MELHQALENIKRIKPIFAEEEIHCIREHKDEATPVLLQHVQDIANNPSKYVSSEGLDDPLYAMFLLAEFRANDALEPFVKMLETEKEAAYLLLGDVISESSGRLIASVAQKNDIDRIKLVIENTEVDEFQRIAALEALITMYFTGAYSREELVSYLGYLLNLASEPDDNDDDDSDFLTLVVYSCRVVDAKEHFSHITELYDKEMVDTSAIEREAFTWEEESENEREKTPAKYILDRYTLIHDTIKEMHWWHCFKPEKEDHLKKTKLSSELSSKPKPAESKKVGRNDPCPCGSGKKYKKCCLNKG